MSCEAQTELNLFVRLSKCSVALALRYGDNGLAVAHFSVAQSVWNLCRWYVRKYVMVGVPQQAIEIEKAAEGVCVSKQVSSVPAQYSVVGVDYTMNIVILSNTTYNHTEHHIRSQLIPILPGFDAFRLLRTHLLCQVHPSMPSQAASYAATRNVCLRTRQLEEPTGFTSQPGTETHRSSFEFQGALEYNKLPQNTRCISNLQSRC